MKTFLFVLTAIVFFTSDGYGQVGPLFMAVHDLDGDGNPDVVTIPYKIRPVSIAASDLDGDGHPDLVTANSPSRTDKLPTLSVLLGNGDGTFYPGPAEIPLYDEPLDIAPPERILVADFDGDGIGDLAITENTGKVGKVAVLLGAGGGLFEPTLRVSVGSDAQALTSADLNRDGWVDLAVVNQDSNSISVMLGLGDGTFERLAPDLETSPCVNYGSLSECDNASAIIAADFDRDGHADLATASRAGNTISLFMGIGDGQFGAKRDFYANSGLVDLIPFDANYDGVIDLVALDRFPTGVSILMGHGDGTFLPAIDLPSDRFAIEIGGLNPGRAGLPEVTAGLDPSMLAVLLLDPVSRWGAFTHWGALGTGASALLWSATLITMANLT